jgi:hypothetical protein
MNKGLFGGQVVGERIRQVVCVIFSPKPVHHQVHVFQLGTALEFCSKQLIQVGKSFLKLGGSRSAARRNQNRYGALLICGRC